MLAETILMSANTNMDKTPIWDKINGEFVTEFKYFRKLEKLRLLNQAWYDKSKQQEVKLRAENYPNSLDIVPSAGKVIEDERDLRNIIEEQPDE